MGILDGSSKNEPLHQGEVYHMWTFSTLDKGAISFYQAYHNHAGDKDLRKLLDKLIDQAREESQRLDRILLDSGIVPPPALPDRPKVHFEDIPPGARLSDMEIAVDLGVDLSISLATCSTIMGISLRKDISAMFSAFHVARAALGAQLLELTKDKGWLLSPPMQLREPQTTIG